MACLHPRAAGWDAAVERLHWLWVYGRMGLFDRQAATNCKEPDRFEASNMGKLPIDRTHRDRAEMPYQSRSGA
jgi:hypothetical protein